MAKVIFIYKGQKTSIICKNEDKMKDIINIFKTRYNINIDLLYFIYNGNIINLELSFNEQANSIDLGRNEMNILVYESKEYTNINNPIIVKSKEVICPECDESCRFNIKDYKIDLYECKNNHKMNNLLLDEYNNTQFINESKIICNICNTTNKSKTFNNEFYKCTDCQKNICPFCKLSHDKNHIIIEYNKKNYICQYHNIPDNFFCYDCKVNLCEKCEENHSKHKKVYFKDILSNEYEIMEEVKEFRKKIDKFNDNINLIIKILEKVKINMEIYYKINYDLINNYKKENINYQILENINEIKNNIKLNDIDEIINDNDIKNKFKNILNLYEK